MEKIIDIALLEIRIGDEVHEVKIPALYGLSFGDCIPMDAPIDILESSADIIILSVEKEAITIKDIVGQKELIISKHQAETISSKDEQKITIELKAVRIDADIEHPDDWQ